MYTPSVGKSFSKMLKNQKNYDKWLNSKGLKLNTTEDLIDMQLGLIKKSTFM
jgi:hypothetical protein